MSYFVFYPGVSLNPSLIRCPSTNDSGLQFDPSLYAVDATLYPPPLPQYCLWNLEGDPQQANASEIEIISKRE